MKNKRYFGSPAITLFGLGTLGLFLAALSISTGNVHAAPKLVGSDVSSPGAGTNRSIYLPLVLRNYAPSIPRLAAPINGAVLDTLIPTFSWDTGIQPADTYGCLAFGTTPDPTSCQMAFLTDYSDSHWDQVMWFNLQPGTIYYWRVGTIYNEDFDHPTWSTEWSFTTGAAGGALPSAPLLQSPANNSTVSTEDITLSWQAVTGAIEYSISLHALDTDIWIGLENTADPEFVLDIGSYVNDAANQFGLHYGWSVATRNSYGWSNSSDTWKFTFSKNSAISKGLLIPGETFLLRQAGMKVQVFR